MSGVRRGVPANEREADDDSSRVRSPGSSPPWLGTAATTLVAAATLLLGASSCPAQLAPGPEEVERYLG
ncbi:MAG: hypothetical protein ACREF4_08395, partial [Gammaproteobacteria bacterium]